MPAWPPLPKVARTSVCGLSLLLSLASLGGTQEPPAALRVDVKLVAVNARVADPSGAPVPGLRQEDFRLFEDDKEQVIALVEPLTAPLHVALLMDTSASTERNLKLLRESAEHFLEDFSAADQLALYQVGPRVGMLAGFTQDRKKLQRSLRSLESTAEAGTVLYDALGEAQRSFPAGSRRHAVVVFTDGVDEGSQLGSEAIQRMILQGNTSFYAVMPSLGPAPPSAAAAGSSAGGTWVIVFDLAAGSGDTARLFQETALDFFGELAPQAQVWMYDYRRLLRLLERQIGLDAPVPRALSPEEAKSLVKQVGTPQPMRLPRPTRPLRRVENLLVLTDRKRTGLPALEQFFDLQSAAILVPEEVSVERRRQLLGLLVHHRDEVRRMTWWRLRVAHDRLAQLADDTGGQVFEIKDAGELRETLRKVGEQLRASYALGYYSRASPGRHLVRVEVRGREVTVRARRVILTGE